jgi:hypothetical protein
VLQFLFVGYTQIIVPTLFGLFFFSSIVLEGYAIELTTVVVPSMNEAQAQFTADRILTMTYDPNSSLSKNLTDIHENVNFRANMSTPGMRELISTVNQAILTEKQSPAQIQNATLDYNARIDGSPGQLKVSYLVKLKPMLEGVTLPSQNTSINIVDLDWRSFVVPQALNLTVNGIGQINVNHPIGLFENKLPIIASELKGSELGNLLMEPLFDFELIGQSLDTWHFLFDPTGSQAGMLGSGFEEIGGAKVVSIFSLGESSFREGTFKDIEQEAKATIDGTSASTHIFTSKPSAQIQIAGFAQVSGKFVTVTEDAPQGTSTATGGFPIQVLLILGGMMAAVAVFVLLKARK